jgi:hypothetical protein
MELAESYIATYHIYVLKNPANNEIFYVGKTQKDLKVRLSGHISDTGSSTAKGKYLKAIYDNGGKPIIEAVETIYGTCYIDRVKSLHREIYWIQHFKSAGCPLTNSMSMDDNSYNLEYQRYLNDIEEAKFNWAYYYCGKTKYGVNVYDEERVNEDGFVFNINKEDLKPKYVIGEETHLTTNITYHNVYDDENPNYITSSHEEI